MGNAPNITLYGALTERDYVAEDSEGNEWGYTATWPSAHERCARCNAPMTHRPVWTQYDRLNGDLHYHAGCVRVHQTFDY